MLQFDFDKLGLSLSVSAITMGKTVGFDLFVRNNSSEPMALLNSKQIRIEDAPNLDDPLEGNESMVCFVRFDYGDAAGSLTSVADSQLITGSLPSAVDWSIVKVETGPLSPYWKFMPQKDVQLAPGDCITVRFENIHCSDLYGEANLYFILCYDSKYTHNIPIMKAYMPKINFFKPQQTLYHLGDTITMIWELENADGCTQFFRDQIVPKGDRKKDVTVKSEDRYCLNVINQAEDGVSQAYETEVPCIDTFELKHIDHDQLTLSWKAFPSDTKDLTLKEFPNEKLELTDSKTFSQVTDSDRSFTLIAKQKDSCREVTRTISYCVPTLEASANRIYRLPKPIILPALDDSFLPIDFLGSETGLERSIVAKKRPPTPPSPSPTDQVTFHWTTKHVSSIKIYVGGQLLGSYCPYDEPTVTISTRYSSATVVAEDSYGYQIQQTVNF